MPIVTIKPRNVKHNLGDFLLGCAVAIAIKGLQHPSQSCATLMGQSGLRRNGTPMKDREQTADSLQPIESIEVERDERGKRRAGRRVGGLNEPGILTVTEIVEQIGLVASGNGASGRDRGLPFKIHGDDSRGFTKNDGARVLQREPENASLRRGREGIHREIATPTAGESCR